MFKRLAMAALAAAVMAAASAPSMAQQDKKPATASATASDKKKGTSKPVSPAVAAMRERQRKCGAEWREAKAAGKTQKGMKWPQYWSACNKRLKGAGA